MKLASVSICYKDGDPSIKDPESSLHNREFKLRIIKTPSLIEFSSYCFSCIGCLCGPVFEYKEFIDFINKEGRYMKIPPTYIPGLKILV
jgi:lysophospholipid acyltransferase